MSMKRASAVLMALALIFSMSGCSGTDSKKDGELHGTIEAVEVDINSKLPGRVAEVLVEEGDKVNKGDVIAIIDSDELLAKKNQMQAQVDAALSQYNAAMSQVDAANAQLEKAQNGARRQDVAKAQAAVDFIQQTYERVERLYEKGAVSRQKRDEVKLQLDVARQDLDMALEGARAEDISGAQAMAASAMNMASAAKAKYDQAQAGLDEVMAYIDDTTIESPIDGTVTTVAANAGELVSTGMSIAVVSDTSDMWIEVDVEETKVEKLKEGDYAQVQVLALSGKQLEAKIVSINKNPDFAVKKGTDESGNYDIISYGVKLKLEGVAEGIRPGMSAKIKFKE